VDEALKYIISMGVVAPPMHLTRVPGTTSAPDAHAAAARNQLG